jgi:hypothetical protein
MNLEGFIFVALDRVSPAPASGGSSLGIISFQMLFFLTEQLLSCHAH